jgi:ATP-dependent RNA helicase DeaD
VLCRLIDLQDIKFALIFCATKMMVDELTDHLTARGYGADKMHGDMTQTMRERVMAKFRNRGLEFLVATDVAARGLDVDDIEVVFNYDLPHDGDDYIHRIGRTGRAGRSGRAITFVSGRELYKMQNIIRFTKGKIRRENIPSEEEVEQKRANSFYDSLHKTLETGKYERQDALIGRLLDQGFLATDIASALIHLFSEGEEAEPVRKEQRDPWPTSNDRGGSGRPTHPERKEARASSPGSGLKADRTSGEISHEPGMVRLILGVGREHNVQPGDIVGVIVGLTKLPKESIGVIRLQPKQAFVDVAEEHAELIVTKLNGIQFKGRKLWCKNAAVGVKKIAVPPPNKRDDTEEKAPAAGS